MKKALKIGAAVLALLLILGLGVVANGLLGNPVSKYLAKRSIQAYIDETYPGQELVLERVGYNFKNGDYFGYVVQPGSQDVHFSVNTDGLGRVRYDDYAYTVANRFNTYQRIEDSYRAITDPVLESLPGYDFGYGSLACDEGKAGEHEFALPMSELELDGEYDVRAIGAEIGVLIVYMNDDDVTTQRAAELLTLLRDKMDEAAVPFRKVELTLWHPKTEEGYLDPQQVYAHLLYEELEPDGLPERVEQSNAAVQETYRQMDKENKP